MQHSLISIVVPSYNKEIFISETILSVVAQTYQHWELIIVDDLSTDDTIKVIESYKINEPRIRLYSNEINKGANYSRNFGIEKAKGDYLIFLDADDLLAEHCLKNRLEYIVSEKIDLCVFTMTTFYKEKDDSKSIWTPDSETPLIDFLQHKLPWQTMQPIWNKEFLIKLGGFDENFSRLQDVELHTRALFFDHCVFKQIVSEPDCYYRIDEDRKNFNAFELLSRRIASSNLYCTKFYNQAKSKGLKKYLTVTIYKTYLQLLFQYKIKSINQSQFLKLEKMIMNEPKIEHIIKPYKILFAVGKFFALFPIRIPGFNWLIYKVLII